MAYIKTDRRYLKREEGDAVDLTAWTSASITVGTLSGTFTSASGTMRYKKIGKTVFLSFQITVTTFGTGTYPTIENLPFTPASSGAHGQARETQSTGNMWCCNFDGSDRMYLTRYDNNGTVADGHVFMGSAVYETND